MLAALDMLCVNDPFHDKRTLQSAIRDQFSYMKCVSLAYVSSNGDPYVVTFISSPISSQRMICISLRLVAFVSSPISSQGMIYISLRLIENHGMKIKYFGEMITTGKLYC